MKGSYLEDDNVFLPLKTEQGNLLTPKHDRFELIGSMVLSDSEGVTLQFWRSFRQEQTLACYDSLCISWLLTESLHEIIHFHTYHFLMEGCQLESGGGSCGWGWREKRKEGMIWFYFTEKHVFKNGIWYSLIKNHCPITKITFLYKVFDDITLRDNSTCYFNTKNINFKCASLIGVWRAKHKHRNEKKALSSLYYNKKVS